MRPADHTRITAIVLSACAAATLWLAACSGRDTSRAVADDTVPAATGAPAAEPAPTRATPQPAPSGQTAQEAEDSIHEMKLFEARRNSMGKYKDCIAQARGLVDPGARATIMTACGRLPDAPRGSR